jgi:hypothetical protein
MSYVDTTAYSAPRAGFWTRPHSLLFTWPVLIALLLLLLAAGAIAVAHRCAPRLRLHRAGALRR